MTTERSNLKFLVELGKTLTEKLQHSDYCRMRIGMTQCREQERKQGGGELGSKVKIWYDPHRIFIAQVRKEHRVKM